MIMNRNTYLKAVFLMVVGLSADLAQAQLVFEPAAVEKKEVSGDALPWLTQEKTHSPEVEVAPVRKRVDVETIEDGDAALLVTVNFPLRFMELQDSHKDVLNLRLRDLKHKSDIRIQLRSFATPKLGHAGEERRIALRRGLSARDYLTAIGFDKKNIYIQALGKKLVGGCAKDRIDIFELR